RAATRLCLRVALFVTLMCPCARAQQTQTQVLPEVDTYVGLTERFRLLFLIERPRDGTTLSATEFGPNLDVNLRPFLRRKLDSNDAAKGNWLTLRVGYEYFVNEGKPDENRVHVGITSRFHLPKSVLLSNRNRFEFRFINGVYSWRYRCRLTLERSFS